MTSSAPVAPVSSETASGVSPFAAESLAVNGDQVVVVPLTALPDEQGLLCSRSLELPRWIRCCYYAPFQRHAINPALDLWPEGYNQCHPLPIRSEAELGRAKRGGMFAVFETTDGSFLAILPLVGTETVAWLGGDGATSLLVHAAHFGASDRAFQGELPLFASAFADTPYAAAAKAWALAFSHPLLRGLGCLREEKSYPEMFEYLGWCSFEEYKLAINERVIVDALRSLAESPVPVRWALIDDGHIDDGSRENDPLLQTQEGVVGGPGQTNAATQTRRLHSANPHPEKFPNGWSSIRAIADADPRLRWLGLWLNYNGYWGAIAADHQLGVDVDRHLVSLDPADPRSAKLPGEKPGDADAFHAAFMRPVSEHGFDFIKVDNQAANLRFYAESPAVENGVRAAVEFRHAFEREASARFTGVIGCMAHNNLCVLHQPKSQVMRCSEDYKKEDTWRAKHHLHNSFGNMLWMGQTVWGDHDMFHSSDRVAGALMARSKAISGGPVYLSDHPSNFVRELITPLHLADGRVLRPLAPAVPLPESVFIDPYEDDEAYRVIAPLPHGCAALAAYNLTEPEKTVRGVWHMNDLRHRSAMLSERASAGVSGGQEAGVLLYDTRARTARALCIETPAVRFHLAPLSDAFVILSPIVHGWALIGNPDKYLPPSFVAEAEVSGDGVSMTLATWESGPVLLWHVESGIRRVDIPAGGKRVVVTK